MVTPPSSSATATASAALAGGVGLVLLAGPTLPLAWGILPAALALALALASARAGGRGDLGEAPAVHMPRVSRWLHWLLVGLTVAPAIVVLAIAARVIAALCVEVPSVIAALVVLVVLAPMLARPRARLAASLAIVVAGAALVAAGMTTRFEAAGPGARGFAHTGPILGIHPFQTAAIVIDGFGPFDLPINDYVEPDGSRGYGPVALAEALQRDLAAIAEQQFAPAVDRSAAAARGYAAFAGARVEAIDMPAVQERLDRPPERGDREPRLLVWSGTTGPRSRVEFLCPGSRNDPRPRGADDVMQRMCPDKYSSEASAGLGLTGRWTGYTEGRGLARLSLARALGWSRGDVREAAATGLWERRLWAWLVLALLVPLVLWPAGARGLARAAAGVSAAAVAVLVGMSVCTWPEVQVSLLERATPWASPWRLGAWTPALAIALMAGLGRRAAIVPAVTLAVGTWAVAGALAATLWVGPIADDPAALVAGLAGVAVRATDLDLATAEAIAASVVLAGMLGVIAAVLGPGMQRVQGLVQGRVRWIGLAALGAAGLLVLSRKTLGGAALLTPALALALVACTGRAAQAAVGRGQRMTRGLHHLWAVGLTLWSAGDAWFTRSNPFMAAAVLVAAVLALASLLLLVGPRAVRSPQEGPPKPPQA